MAQLSSASREYIRVRVKKKVAGSYVDPTGDTVEFAFKTSETAEPEAGDWVAGSWESAGGVYWARCLVGPGGTTELADGTYWVWVRISGATEIPVKQAPGKLVVT